MKKIEIVIKFFTSKYLGFQKKKCENDHTCNTKSNPTNFIPYTIRTVSFNWSLNGEIIRKLFNASPG